MKDHTPNLMSQYGQELQNHHCRRPLESHQYPSPFVKIIRRNQDVVFLFLEMVIPKLEVGHPLHIPQQTTIARTLPTLLILSQISHEWRTYIQAQPQLWNQLVLTSTGHLDAFRHCIQYSDETPLHVKVDYYPHNLPPAVAKEIRNISGRIRTLYLSASHQSLQGLYLNLPKALDIFFRADDISILPNTQPSILLAPNSRHLKIHRIVSTAWASSYNNVISAEFRAIQLVDLCTLLESATGLQKLIVTLLKSERPDRELTHNKLEEFVLDRGQIHNGHGILAIVSFPKLRHLTLSQNDKDAVPFIRRSRCRLVSFGLQRLDDLALTPIVNHQSIMDLYVHGMDLEKVVFLLHRCILKHEYESLFQRIRRIIISVPISSIPAVVSQDRDRDMLHGLVTFLHINLRETCPPIQVDFDIHGQSTDNACMFHGDIDPEGNHAIIKVNGVNVVDMYNTLQ